MAVCQEMLVSQACGGCQSQLVNNTKLTSQYVHAKQTQTNPIWNTYRYCLVDTNTTNGRPAQRWPGPVSLAGTFWFLLSCFVFICFVIGCEFPVLVFIVNKKTIQYR